MTNIVRQSMNQLEVDVSTEIQNKYYDKFCKFSSYLGNGVYEINGIISTDTRELFLKYCAHKEGIKFLDY